MALAAQLSLNYFLVGLLVFLSLQPLQLIHTLSIPDTTVPVDKSVQRRLAVEQNKKSKILNQKWYREKQQFVSSAQKLATRQYWPRCGIDLKYGVKVDLESIFPANLTYFVLDIGFGMGDSLVEMARCNPTAGYLGCEIHRSGIGAALIKMHTPPIVDNIRIIRSDVTTLVDRHLSERCLDEICVFFPDPWPNAERDGERRVIRTSMVDRFERILKLGGRLRIATDVEDYAVHTQAIMNAREQSFKCDCSIEHEACVGGPADRSVTKYEARARELGHRVWDFSYTLITPLD